MRIAAALVILACAACSKPAPTPTPTSAPRGRFHFVDVAAKAGLTESTYCGRPEKPHLLESGGSGCALFDADGDGDLDLFVVDGWRLSGKEIVRKAKHRFYRNRGDGTFDDATAECGIEDDAWGCGVAVGDADGDRDPDLFITNFEKDSLWLNDGRGRFMRAENSPGIDGWSTGAVFFDPDKDGDQDLFVAAYVECTMASVLDAQPTLDWHDRKVMLGPFGLEGKANAFFENTGGGQFVEATERFGLVDVGEFFSFGVVAADLDADTDVDLYVANDSNPNYLYENDGKGRFKEIGLWSGAALDKNGAAQAGMGVAAADVDDDGFCDLFVTNFELDFSTFYRRVAPLTFVDESAVSGIGQPTYGPLSWGTGFFDFDHDGDQDLFVANGHIYPQADHDGSHTSFKQRNLMLENLGGRFEDRTAESGPGLLVKESSRGAAFGDIDGDGDIDIVVTNIDAPPTLLRNDGEKRGRYLIIDAPDALRVEVTIGSKTLTRFAVAGGSFLSVSDRRFHFGVGAAAKVDRVRVFFAADPPKDLTNVTTDRIVHVDR